MKDELPHLPLELARELVELALKIRDLKPWDLLSNEDIFGLEGPSDDLWGVSVMGAGGEVYGLGFYRGSAGISFLSYVIDDMIEDDEERMDLWAELDSLTVEWVPAGKLTPSAKALLKVAGTEISKGSRQRYPEFARSLPDRPPRPLNTEDARLLLDLLRHFLAAYSVIEEDPELIEWDSFGLNLDFDDEETLENMIGEKDIAAFAQELLANAPDDVFDDLEDTEEPDYVDFPIWSGAEHAFVRRNLDAPLTPLYPLDFPPPVQQRLFRLMNVGSKGRWEIGRVFAGIIEDGGDGEGTAFSEALLVVDSASGFVLGVEAGFRRDRAGTLSRLLGSVLMKVEQLPETMVWNDDNLHRTLTRFCHDYGVEVAEDETPLLDEAIEDLLRSMH